MARAADLDDDAERQLHDDQLHDEHHHLGEDDDDEPKTLKGKVLKYLKLVGPHVGLVVAVCLFATLFAVVCARIERPHEEQVRAEGVVKVVASQRNLVQRLWQHGTRGQKPLSREEWRRSADQLLSKHTSALYSTFSDNMVSYDDISDRKLMRSAPGSGGGKRRQRRSAFTTATANSPIGTVTNDDGDELDEDDEDEQEVDTANWRMSNAIFFAATTMSTIGYGNIAPVTAWGRVACVLLSLVGCPLTIVTIGDLGKFLSECVVWLYKKLSQGLGLPQMRDMCHDYGRMAYARLAQGPRAHQVIADLVERREQRSTTSSQQALEDLFLDKTKVPVALVFAVLITYIAFGAVIFSIMEKWTYIDSFYFCFITLTTVGFGDLVPQQYQYLPIMFVYIGIGLSVTTMCIDLVGVKYVQKIHYFGRKFKGYDLLQYLKRKKMLEQGFGNNPELIEFYMQQMVPAPETDEEDPFAVDNEYTYEEKPPTPRSLRSVAPSVEQRALAYRNCKLTRASWANAGLPDESSYYSVVSSTASPTVHRRGTKTAGVLSDRGFYSPVGSSQLIPSLRCSWGSYRSSLGSHASVHGRAALYAAHRWRSPSGSLVTFYSTGSRIAKMRTSPDTPSSARRRMYSRLRSPAQSTVTEFEYYYDMDAHVPMSPSGSIPARQRMYAPAQADRWTGPPDTPHEYFYSFGPPLPRTKSLAAAAVWHRVAHNAPSTSKAHAERVTFVVRRPMRLSSCAGRFLPEPPSPIGMAYMEGWEIYHKYLEWAQRPYVRPPDVTIEVASSSDDDLDPPPLLSPLETEFPSSLVGSPTGFDMGAFEVSDADLLLRSEPVMFHEEMPIHSVHHHTVDTEAALESLMSAPDSMLTAEVPPKFVADNYCFVVNGERVNLKDITAEQNFWKHTSRPVRYFFSADLRKFRKVQAVETKGRILSARFPESVVIRQATVAEESPPSRKRPTSLQRQEQSTESSYSIASQASASTAGSNTQASANADSQASPARPSSPPTTIDASGSASMDSLGGAERMIYCDDSPVYATAAQAKDAEQTIEDCIRCDPKYITKNPPRVVTDNYCFVVDGAYIGDDEHAQVSTKVDEKYWKHTGKSLKHYWTKDQSKFIPVQTIIARGTIISATVRHMPGPDGKLRKVKGAMQVPLSQVIEVKRWYSCWHSSPHFHRIVTHVTSAARVSTTNVEPRTFVQYLWRGARDDEKRRVQIEYQMLLQRNEDSGPGTPSTSAMSRAASPAPSPPASRRPSSTAGQPAGAATPARVGTGTTPLTPRRRGAATVARSRSTKQSVKPPARFGPGVSDAARKRSSPASGASPSTGASRGAR